VLPGCVEETAGLARHRRSRLTWDTASPSSGVDGPRSGRYDKACDFPTMGVDLRARS
jgi:hypothetical protein